jgi:anti-anti-sigma regulatory factor
VVAVEKKQKGNVLSIHLSGSIDETVDFASLLGSPQPEMEINCKAIPRINSIGVKAWIRYFQGCLTAGTKLTFVECSTAIVEQINLILNFTCGGKVESIFVPFSCPFCKSELTGLFKTDELKKLQYKLPEYKCTLCGKGAIFDDIPEEYFSFLMR